MKDKGSEFACCDTLVYDYNTIAGRKETREQLKMINNTMMDPWLILGDFNTIQSVNDRINGAPIQQPKTQDFQDFIDDIGLGQICIKRCQFSWCNKRDIGDRIHILIDWVFGNSQWMSIYSNLEAHYLSTGCSDHSPILITTMVARKRLPRPFRLLNILLHQKSFTRATQYIWGYNIPGHAMCGACKQLKHI